MMEKFIFLDEAGEPIPNLTYSEETLAWGATFYHESINGFATIMSLAAILVDHLAVEKDEQDSLLKSIRAIKEEHSGAAATREQIIDAVKADPEKFARNLRDLFRVLPELDNLKQKLRLEWGEKLYAKYIKEEQNFAPSPVIPYLIL